MVVITRGITLRNLLVVNVSPRYLTEPHISMDIYISAIQWVRQKVPIF